MLLCYSNMYDNMYSDMYNTVTICHLKNALQKVIPKTMLEISIRDDFNKEKQISVLGVHMDPKWTKMTIWVAYLCLRGCVLNLFT